MPPAAHTSIEYFSVELVLWGIKHADTPNFFILHPPGGAIVTTGS